MKRKPNHRSFDNDPRYQELRRKFEWAEKIKDAWEDDPYIPVQSIPSYNQALREYEEAKARLDAYVSGAPDDAVVLDDDRKDLDSDADQAVEDLYENRRSTQEIAPIIVDINQEIMRYLARHPEKLYDLSPRKFEELVAAILKDFGFDVELTPAARDGGKDIYAYVRNQVSTFLMFVECKRWTPPNHVGLEVVQRLYGVQQINQANKSMIVTTSFFTKPAIEESRRFSHLMDLRDYNDLKEWLQRYG